MPHVFVIGEAGISHDGDLTKALKMIDQAREAKADAVKFQTFNAAALCKRRGKPELAEILKPYEMPLTWLPVLKGHCDKVGIEFMTTCFDEETVRIVNPYVKRFKIGHGEVGDEALFAACMSYGKPVIRSVPTTAPVPMPLVSTLYVTTKYPTPANEVYLKRLRHGFDGFSDHTQCETMGALAVAAGAKIVEVHFREWYTANNNLDRAVSHDPYALIRYIELIRQAESAVYGADSEETRKLARPGSAPHTSHPPASGASDPSGGPQAAAS